MAQDREHDHEPAHSRPPVSAHPAFPLIVGLWFAALLGLGTVVMPAVVLEQVTRATGLAGVFPQAEPPLNPAVRAAFALVATLVGLAGGLALARRVTRAQHAAHPPRRRRTATGRAAPRPLSVHDDLGDDAFAPTVDQPRIPGRGRRRALTTSEDPRPSDFLLAAPLPGDETTVAVAPAAHADATSDQPDDIALAAQPEAADDALDLTDLAADFDLPADAADIAAPAPYVPPLDTRKPRPAAAMAASGPLSGPLPGPLDAAAVVDPEPIDGPLDRLGIVQLAERLGRSLRERQEAMAQAAAAAPAPSAEPATDEAPEPLAFSAPSLDSPADADGDDEPIAVPPPVVPEGLRAFMETPEADLPFAPLPAAPEAPAALVPLAFDALEPEDEPHDPGPFTLPLESLRPRAFDAPAEPLPAYAAALGDEDEDDEDEDEFLPDGEDSYSSLLSMTNPFRPHEEFVRVDEPEADDDAVEPAVVFPADQAPPSESAAAAGPEATPAVTPRPFDAPHEAAPSTAPARAVRASDPAETERALRSALANLQRMSGAA